MLMFGVPAEHPPGAVAPSWRTTTVVTGPDAVARMSTSPDRASPARNVPTIGVTKCRYVVAKPRAASTAAWYRVLLVAVGQTAVVSALVAEVVGVVGATVVELVVELDADVVAAGAEDGVVGVEVGFELLPHADVAVAIATSPIAARCCFMFVMA